MARVVRKVSNVNASGKKTFWKLSKKQTWIFASILTVVLLVAAGLITYFSLANSTESEEIKTDYFLNSSKVEESLDVKFEKSTFGGAINYAVEEELGVDYLFVFGYDSTAFYPAKNQYFDKDSDGNDVDRYVKEHRELYEQLVNLQQRIDYAKSLNSELASNLKLVIIDTAKGDGASLLTSTTDNKDEKQVKFVREDASSEKFVFSFLRNGSLVESEKINDVDRTLYGTGITMKNDAVQNALLYVNKLIEGYNN